MNITQIIKQVKKIEITTKHLVDGLVSGNYHSIFKGQGIEFSEIRDYNIGDDVRAIDWKVTARYDHPFIKEFIEERDLRIYFVFDISASNTFGNLVEKKEKAIEFVATLMFSALKNNDNVGLFIVTNGIEKYIPPRKGKAHIMQLISTLITSKPKSKQTNLKESLSKINNVIKKRSVIFVVSDFYSDDFEKPLSILRKKHDVIALKSCDLREKEMPDVGLIELEDCETNEQILVDTSDEEFRKNYLEVITKHDTFLKKTFKKNKIGFIELMSNEAYENSLRSFFRIRKMRSRI